MYQCILASGSPRRKEILEQCGIPFTICKSDASEDVSEKEPVELVKKLAVRKAEEVEKRISRENFIIISADTIVVNQGEILGKPLDALEAKRMIRTLQGNAHSVFTGVCLLVWENGKPKERVTFAEETKVRVACMEESEIEEYVESKEPMDKAGSYAIQGQFGCYIEGIEGDYYNVVGLPICRLRKEAKKIGIDLRKDCENMDNL